MFRTKVGLRIMTASSDRSPYTKVEKYVVEVILYRYGQDVNGMTDRHKFAGSSSRLDRAIRKAIRYSPIYWRLHPVRKAYFDMDFYGVLNTRDQHYVYFDQNNPEHDVVVLVEIPFPHNLEIGNAINVRKPRSGRLESKPVPIRTWASYNKRKLDGRIRKAIAQSTRMDAKRITIKFGEIGDPRTSYILDWDCDPNDRARYIEQYADFTKEMKKENDKALAKHLAAFRERYIY